MSFKKLFPKGMERWQVTGEAEELRLVDWLVQQKPEMSATSWRHRIDEGLVWVDGQPVKLASRKVKPGTMVLSAPREPQSWKVLEQADGLVILYKPPGVLFDEVSRHLQELNLPKTYPLHRLDKMTSGLLMVGLDSKTASEIDRSFKTQMIDKRYLAFCWGKPEKNQGTVQTPLMKKSALHGGAHVRPSEEGEEGAMEASTNWKLLAHKEGLSLIECEPLSGRTHQIRSHLQNLGCPVIGDLQYQTPIPSKAWWGNLMVTQHMLHAYSLKMTWKEKPYLWKAPLSLEFQRLAQWMDPTGDLLGSLIGFQSS